MDNILEKIAQDRLGITLERQGNDSDDFHDISVWALKEMLQKAYEVGKNNGKQAQSPSQTKVPMVQRLKKNGEWGVPRDTVRYGNETDEQVVERLNSLNPNEKFRIAQ
ncbi:MAG: hypothetical protein FWB98_03275 [Defluviitaleaceae bacterium]|nr:hypothetical protein [Defluviitaleaceae bacterium]